LLAQSEKGMHTVMTLLMCMMTLRATLIYGSSRSPRRGAAKGPPTNKGSIVCLL